MKTDWTHLEAFRKRTGPYGSETGRRDGAFFLKIGKTEIICIVSQGCDEIPWEHVSARAIDYKGERTPLWSEMCYIKDLFWDEEECVIQYHPPRSDYVNNHPHVLHLWKPIGIEFPRPPSICVGIK